MGIFESFGFGSKKEEGEYIRPPHELGSKAYEAIDVQKEIDRLNREINILNQKDITDFGPDDEELLRALTRQLENLMGKPN